MIFLEDSTIPIALWDALVASNEEYGEEVGDYLKGHKGKPAISVTSLSRPPRPTQLMARHNAEIFIDPLKDCWHSMMGSVIHWVLEKHASRYKHLVAEHRLGTDITVDSEKIHIHGKFDIYDKREEALEDWKLTSANSLLYDKEEHRLQLNRLRYILMENGYKVRKLRNIYLIPHLDKTKFLNPEYPKRNAVMVDVPLMPIKEVVAGIKERARAQMAARQLTDNDLPYCTDEERWIRQNFWLAYTRKKGGRKGILQPFSSRSSKKTDTKKEMIKWRKSNGIPLSHIKYKNIKGHPTKCDYCKAAPFCNQLQKELLVHEQSRKNK